MECRHRTLPLTVGRGWGTHARPSCSHKADFDWTQLGKCPDFLPPHIHPEARCCLGPRLAEEKVNFVLCLLHGCTKEGTADYPENPETAPPTTQMPGDIESWEHAVWEGKPTASQTGSPQGRSGCPRNKSEVTFTMANFSPGELLSWAPLLKPRAVRDTCWFLDVNVSVAGHSLAIGNCGGHRKMGQATWSARSDTEMAQTLEPPGQGDLSGRTSTVKCIEGGYSMERMRN